MRNTTLRNILDIKSILSKVLWRGPQAKAKEFHDLCFYLYSIFAKLLRSTDVKIVHIFICFRSGVDEKIFPNNS